MKYCGCVTDMEYKHALLEMYPNRKSGSRDSMNRAEFSSRQRDLPELAIESTKYEARRVYDIPKECLPDLNAPRWVKARSAHLLCYVRAIEYFGEHFKKKIKGLPELLCDIERIHRKT